MMTRLLACVLTVLVASQSLKADDSARLIERLTAGSKYRVRLRVELSGQLQPPGKKGKAEKPVRLDGTSTVDYDERVLVVDSNGQATKTLRVFDRLVFRRTLAGQNQELTLRQGVRRQVLLRKGHTEVPFSPDGPLTWGEIDAVRTDVFTPALLGMLPDKEVKVGDKWPATTAALQELTDLEKPDGTLECKLEKLTPNGKKTLARVHFSGTIRGVGEDGPAQHRLQGHYHFDVEGGYLADMTLLGTTTMVDDDNKEVGRIEGRFTLARSPAVTARELEDEAVKGLKAEPDEGNTLLLYDNAELGVRFLHARRWRVAQVMGAQVALATSDGNGVLITVDPSESVPTAAAFLEESRGFLVKQKARVTRTYSPRRLRERPTLDGFALEAELGKQKMWLDYYVTAQAGGGATIAGRMGEADLAELRREVEKIAKSVEVTKRIVPEKAGRK